MKNIKSTPRELRNFGFLVGGIFLVLGAWFGYSGRHSWELVTALGALLVFFGAVFPRVLAPVYKAWMALGAVLGWVMTRLLLSILFFAVFTPIGLLMRMFGKRFLDLRFKPKKSAKTYWRYRKTKRSTREQLERQF